jgi:hypothetical protein
MSRNNEHFGDAASNARDEEVLFHGSPEEFNPGDTILPASKIGKEASANPDVAYATPSLHVAKFMAWEQNNYNGANFEDNNEEPPENVYRVAPVNPEEKMVRKGVLMDPTIPRDEKGYLRQSPEVRSSAGFKVLSKMQDPGRTIELKRRLVQIDEDKKGYDRRAEQEAKLEAWRNEQRTTDALRKRQGFVPGETVFRDPDERAFLLKQENRTSGDIKSRIQFARFAKHGEEKNTEFDGLLDELGYKKGE